MAIAAAAGLFLAAVLTREVTGAREIGSSDRSLTFMQRMGPPTTLIGLYHLLAADTVTIRSYRDGRLISTGLYVGFALKPTVVPSLLAGLPRGLKRIIELGASTSDLAYFVAPARGITSRAVLVATQWQRLNGVVVRVDRKADLAAIVIVMPQDQVSKFYVPLPTDRSPAATAKVSLRLLVVHRNPAIYTRSDAFVLTTGSVSGSRVWCAATVHGTSAGSPIAYVGPAGEISLLGLGVPSAASGRCAVIGSWAIAQFMHTALTPRAGGPR